MLSLPFKAGPFKFDSLTIWSVGNPLLLKCTTTTTDFNTQFSTQEFAFVLVILYYRTPWMIFRYDSLRDCMYQIFTWSPEYYQWSITGVLSTRLENASLLRARRSTYRLRFFLLLTTSATGRQTSRVTEY